MAKIAGIGELEEGVLERDPLDESLQLRVLDAEGKQHVRRLQDLLSEYVGHSVRLTIAYTRALEVAEALPEVQAVTFTDLANSRER